MTEPVARQPWYLRPHKGTRVAAVLVLCAIAWVVYRWVDTFVFPGTDLSGRGEIERRAGIRLPPGTRDLKAFHDGAWQDSTLRIRFTLPPAELGLFLSSTAVIEPLSGDEIPQEFTWEGPADVRRPWWRPGTPDRFRAGSGSRTQKDPDGDYEIAHHVLIDETDPGTSVMWLIVE